MQRKALAIPRGSPCSEFGYRDARRGSLEGTELLAPWVGGEVPLHVLEGDVLSLLHEKWYGPCGNDDQPDQIARRQADSSLASTSSGQQPGSSSSGSTQSQRRFWQSSTSSSSSTAPRSPSSSDSNGRKKFAKDCPSPELQTSLRLQSLPVPGVHLSSPSRKSAASTDRRTSQPQSQRHAEHHRAPSSLLAALGTWTKRMTLFAAKQPLPQDSALAAKRLSGIFEVSPSPGKSAAQLSQHAPDSPESWKTCQSGPHSVCPRESAASAPVPTRPPSEHGQPFGSVQTSEDDEDQSHAAWRWRFNRRWAREQARQFQPHAEADDEDDSNWDDVLGYMDACGRPGWQLQIARSASTDGQLSHPSETGTLLLEAAGPEANTGSSEATRKVVAMARRAQHLHQQQLLLELQAEERWSGPSPRQAWVGSMIPAVRADHFGSYNFVLARVTPTAVAAGRPASKQHKLVLRGQAGLSEGRLIDALNRELVQAMSAYHLPKVGLALLGSGTLLWGPGSDSGVQVLPGRISPGGDKEVTSPASLAQLASELLRASLPPHVPITAREGAP